MRVELIAAIVVLAVPVAAQRGGVTAVTGSSAAVGSATVITVRGTNPCSNIRVDYGDGTTETQAVRALPADLTHRYTQPGTYQIRVQGMGNCLGTAAATVRVAAGTTAQPLGAVRFRAMDTNGDGQITRQEWQGSAQSFRVHDWNRDGVLSGDEVRAGGTRQGDPEPDYRANQYVLDDWSANRFQQLDRNRDNRITRQEWIYDYEGFARADRNRDGVLTRAEFLNPDFDDDRVDKFDDLDLNGNNRIEQNEWHASLDAFRWLDRNKDGVLSRAEVAADDTSTGDQFTSLDLNNDRAISIAEWQWSRRSFDQLDVNRDGRLSRSEFNAAGPLGTTGATSTPLMVSANDRWTDTGIIVQAGDILVFNASGTIRMSDDTADVAEPAGARSGRRAPNAPLPNEAAGALIARIGAVAPFIVGANSAEIRATRSGRLYLGVNDDHLVDNSGEFSVTVSVRRAGG